MIGFILRDQICIGYNQITFSKGFFESMDYLKVKKIMKLCTFLLCNCKILAKYTIMFVEKIYTSKFYKLPNFMKVEIFFITSKL